MKDNPNTKKNSFLKTVLLICCFLLVIAILCFIYYRFAPRSTTDQKQITIVVTAPDNVQFIYQDILTDAEYLRGAMEDASSEGLTFSGEVSSYGMMITTINDITADYDKNSAYWAFYVNGEYCNYGIDEQPIADGDTFSIIYTVQ